MKNKNKTVHFSETVTVILIPYEERKGEWMTMALDRYRFKRRIENASNIISPVLEKHLQIIVRNYTTLDDDSQRASYFNIRTYSQGGVCSQGGVYSQGAVYSQGRVYSQ